MKMNRVIFSLVDIQIRENVHQFTLQDLMFMEEIG